jgi:hydroxypyruvate isomerase
MFQMLLISQLRLMSDEDCWSKLEIANECKKSNLFIKFDAYHRRSLI